jgi:hypothetical protein
MRVPRYSIRYSVQSSDQTSRLLIPVGYHSSMNDVHILSLNSQPHLRYNPFDRIMPLR